MSRKVSTRDGDVLDMIALEAYGRTGGATEAILDANPGLAQYGPLLPAGLVIVLPDVAERQIVETVKLWD